MITAATVGEAIYYVPAVCHTLFCSCPHYLTFYNHYYNHFLSILTQAWTLESVSLATILYNWEYYRKRSKVFFSICYPAQIQQTQQAQQIKSFAHKSFCLLRCIQHCHQSVEAILLFILATAHLISWEIPVFQNPLSPFMRTEPASFYRSRKWHIPAFPAFLVVEVQAYDAVVPVTKSEARDTQTTVPREVYSAEDWPGRNGS